MVKRRQLQCCSPADLARQVCWLGRLCLRLGPQPRKGRTIQVLIYFKCTILI
uniref:Uncharacterized protein n=1 Tax=Anguilla anguilla TaxID=7936 RepID=A0A0E9VIH3_ANGAN